VFHFSWPTFEEDGTAEDKEEEEENGENSKEKQIFEYPSENTIFRLLCRGEAALFRSRVAIDNYLLEKRFIYSV